MLGSLATVDFATGRQIDFCASPAPSGAASAPRPPAGLLSPRVPAFVRRMLSPRDSAAADTSANKADAKSSPPACRLADSVRFAEAAGGSSADQPTSPTTPTCRRRAGTQRGPTVPQLSPLVKRTPAEQPGAPRPLNRTVSRSGLVPSAADAPLPWQHRGGGEGTPRGEGDLTPRALARFGVFGGEAGAGTTQQAGPDDDEFNVQ